MLPPGALFELKIHQTVYAAGASPRIPLEKLTELPDPIAGFQGADSRQGGEERGGEKGTSIPKITFAPGERSAWSTCFSMTRCVRRGDPPQTGRGQNIPTIKIIT